MKDAEVSEWFERYGAMVFRRARALLGSEDEAKDVVQEVFVSAFTKLGRFDRSKGAASTWLYRVTTNRCLNLIRDRRRRGEILSDAEVGPTAASSASVEDKIQLARLLSAVEPRCAEAAVYVLMDGMSHAEAAELLGVSRRTVGNLLLDFHRQIAALEPSRSPAPVLATEELP